MVAFDSDRILVVLRHAKSDWTAGLMDHERPLSARGRSDGLAVGAWLAEHGIEPDQALVSTAQRTRETLARVAAGGARIGAVDFTGDIYQAYPDELLDLIRDTDNAVRTLLLVGHNPGVEELVRMLARRVGNQELWASMDRKFPTSAIAVIGFDGAWTDVQSGVGALLTYAVPRGPEV